jgi:hypothetical protein
MHSLRAGFPETGAMSRKEMPSTGVGTTSTFEPNFRPRRGCY